jgi:hypothetical protein
LAEAELVDSEGTSSCRKAWLRGRRSHPPIRNSPEAVGAVYETAHEFRHILQYKSGMGPDGPWQMERHADFLAGWAIDRAWLCDLFSDKDESFNNAVRLIFSLGHTAFNFPDHHGSPELRAAMVRAGQESRHLAVQTAVSRDSQGFRSAMVSGPC